MSGGNKKINQNELKFMSDAELLKVCTTDKNLWRDVCDDDFLRERLGKYPGIEKYKTPAEFWREFYLRVIYKIAKLKEEYNFTYSTGDFEKQYALLKGYKRDKLLYEAAAAGELDVIRYALKDANIHSSNDQAIINASANGHLEVVKYLVQQGAGDDVALRWASLQGHLKVVKYLVQNGANIHANNDVALRWASENGHLEVVKYLVEKGANIHTNNDEALREASRRGHLEVVKYLVEKGANIHTNDDEALKAASQNRHLEVVKYLNNLN